jgi:filamentous hemagglutinin
MTITGSQARQLENALGLKPNSLESRNILSIIDDIANRAPASPISGNTLFKGGGAGLPGGGAELTIQGVPSAGGPRIRQIILEVAP